ncbi:MAG: thymidylate kinase [Oscillospiraceae bacterium]
MEHKLIVFEGTDGSGKSTQFKLLCDRLEAAGKPFQKLIFPQYNEPSSALLKMYLGGEFGTHPSDVNPYAASAFYAVDRYASWKKVWGTAYENGTLTLADRYITSNAVHQASKLPSAERPAFWDWLFDFECDKLGLPRPSKVVFLDMPTDKTVRNLRSRETATHTHADIHEVDSAYLALCHETAVEAAAYYGWLRIDCTDQNGTIRTVEDLHGEIWDKLGL